MVSLSVNPKVSLIDEKLRTIITGLDPNSKVTIRLNVTNKRNLDFESITHFIAFEDGSVDLNTSAPIGHKYYKSPDPMGIFWTMYHLDPSENVAPPMTKSDKRFWALDVENGLYCHFRVYQGHVSSCDIEQGQAILLAEDSSIHRKYMADGVKRLPITEGRIRGTLFMPPGNGPFRAVISMYGGIHRGNVIEDKAALLASRGFASLSLGFFGVDGLPKSYITQPLQLDYFEEAVDFMLNLPQVDNKHGVALSGLSKAGEIVLAMAAFLPDEKLSGVIIMNSVMNYFVQDVMYKGEKVLSGFQLEGNFQEKVKTVGKNLIDILPIIELCAQHKTDQDSIIPFAKSKVDLLFLASEDDGVTTSVDQVQFAETLLKEAGKENYQVCIYEGMGHIVDLPYLPPVHITNHAYFPKPIEVLMGGEDKLAHTKGQVQLWNDTLNFLRRPTTVKSVL